MKKVAMLILILFFLGGGAFSLVTYESVAPAVTAVKATVEAATPTVEAVKPAFIVTKEAEKPVTVVTREAVKPVTVVTKESEKPKIIEKTVKFRDVPSDHWAASSVYDLVNLGVTQGYPDGTFRGNNNITRYETAMFLSKLANALGKTSDDMDIAIEKMKEDLRTEIRSLRAEIAELKRIPEEGEEKPISGTFTSSIIFGNLVAGHTSVEGQTAPAGPLVRYRLQTNFSKNVGEGAKLKINIDTMDSGFGGGSSDLSTKILDVEGRMKLNLGFENPIDVKITSGPGPVVHTEEADVNGNYIARSENNVVYVRPWNSIMFSSKWIGMDIGLGYIARKQSAFGEVEVNQIDLGLGYNFPGLFFFPALKINTNVDYLSSQPQTDPPGPTDTKVTFDTTYVINQKHKLGFVYSFGQGDAPHNVMVGFNFDLLDMWDTGTMVSIKYRKVGSEYLYENAKLNENLFAGLDVFNRYIGDGGGLGIVDVGGEVTQIFTESVKLFTRVDWRLAGDNSYGKESPQCALTIDSGVLWDIATDTLLEALYRVESIPSADDQSTDMVQLDISFKF